MLSAASILKAWQMFDISSVWSCMFINCVLSIHVLWQHREVLFAKGWKRSNFNSMAISLLAYHFHRLYTVSWNCHSLTDFLLMYEGIQARLKTLLIRSCQEGVSNIAASAEHVTPPFFLLLLLESWYSRPKEISLFPLLVWGCVLATWHHSLLEKKKYLAKENDAVHLGFTFSPVKEWSLVHWKIMKVWLSCLHPCHPPCRQWQTRLISELRGTPVLKPNNP